jgi:hypothetical protein
MKNGSIAIMAVGYRLGHVFLDRLGRSARARSCPGALLCPYVAGRASRCRGTHFGDPDGRIRRMAGKVASQVASWLRVSFSKTLLVFHGTLLVVLCRDNIEAMRAHRAGLLAEHWDVHALERASGYLTELLHLLGDYARPGADRAPTEADLRPASVSLPSFSSASLRDWTGKSVTSF